MTARAFSLRFSAAYAFMMLGSGVQLPFLPLWLSAKGISVGGIAFIVAGMMAVRVFGAPLFAWAADHFGHRRTVIRCCAIAAFLAYAAMAMLDGFWPIALAALLAGFLFSPVFPLSEGFSVDASAALGLDYGRMRLWASLSFLSGSIISGALLKVLDPLDAAWILAAAQGLSVISTFLLPPEPDSLRRKSGAPQGGVLRLLFYSSFALFILVAGLAQASHGMNYAMGSLHWMSLGFDTLMISVLWTAAVLSEVTLLAFSNAVMKRFGAVNLFMIGIFGGFIRWIAMAFFTSFPVLLAFQTLHAASFALTHLATMHLIRRMVPAHARNRAQGLYAAMSGGVLLASTSWFSGHLFEAMQGKAYLAMAALSALSLAGALMLFRVSPTTRQLAGA